MKYRLKPGCKHTHFFKGEGHRAIEPGDVVELTESQARAFADRFEPVGKSLKAEDATLSEKDSHSTPRAGLNDEDPAPSENASTSDPPEKGFEKFFSGLSVQELSEELKGVGDPGELDAIERLEADRDGGARKGALKAIADRRQELEESS